MTLMGLNVQPPPSTEMAWTALLVLVLVVAWYGIALAERFSRRKQNRRRKEGRLSGGGD